MCGPFLFVLFINELATVCAPCYVKLYAENVKLYHTIKQPCDRAILQVWTMFEDSNGFLQIGYSDQNIVYKLGDRIINLCDSVSDLGITVHSSLKFSSHSIASIVAKANVRAKLILKWFLSRNPCNSIRALKPMFTLC
jgi:hypothetical protein